MWIVITIAVIYTIGLLAYWLADGWFDFTDGLYNDDKVAYIWLWPITIWWTVATAMRDRVVSAKKIHDEKVAEQIRIRVAAEKELAKTMKALEEEIDVEESCKKAAR